MNTRIHMHVIVIGIGLLMTSSMVKGQCQYSLIPIPNHTMPSTILRADAWGIGDDGSITLNWVSRSNGFETGLWSLHSSLTTLEVPTETFHSKAIGLVDADLVVGYIRELDHSTMTAVLWKASRAHLLSAPKRFAMTAATDVNRHGLIVGFACEEQIGFSLETVKPVMWRNGRFQELETPLDLSGGVIDVNDHGDIVGIVQHFIVGVHPAEVVKWQRGRLRIIGRPEGAHFASSSAINNQRVIVGASKEAPGAVSQPFTWRRGKFENLPLPTWAFGGGANDINELGRIVGWLNTSTSVGFTWAIWMDDTPYDLNTLILDNEYGEFIVNARKINNKGQILVSIGGGFSALIIPVDPPIGDVDKNCLVNVQDLIMLVHEFGKQDSFADVNGDGKVDRRDLLEVIRHFGESNAA